jgi:hypothetical protein
MLPWHRLFVVETSSKWKPTTSKISLPTTTIQNIANAFRSAYSQVICVKKSKKYITRSFVV